MTTSTPTRKEDVKDPIGITGWPKEKGRDGERTPMQWTPGPQAGFSSNPHTWLPIAGNYKTVNVQTESSEPGSLLEWNERLIALRRSNPALHDGGMVMLDSGDADVLAYRRTPPEAGAAVFVAMNMSGVAKTVSIPAGSQDAAVHTLAASDRALQAVRSLHSVTLPPYSSWVGIADGGKQ
jgi:alpha-glucosidase